MLGDYDLQKTYRVISGGLIEDTLAARLTGTKRTRDGYYDDKSGNPDPGNYGDENYSLALRYTPTDTIEINTRGNERSYRRRMAGADAAGIINFVENGQGRTRDTSTYAFGYRAVKPTSPYRSGCDPWRDRRHRLRDRWHVDLSVHQPKQRHDRVCAAAGGWCRRCRPAGRVQWRHHDPRLQQHRSHPNFAYGADASRQNFVGLGGLDGSDLKTDTNGQQDEYFDHQANSTDISWEVNDRFSMKYLFGYTDYFYDRTSDVDLSSNANLDLQFYVSQETEYVSHEMQFFWDPSDKVSITSGLFYYDAKINQRGDYYDSTGAQSRYANNFPYAAIGFGAAPLGPKVGLFTARRAGKRADNGLPLAGDCLPLGAGPGGTGNPFNYCFGGWSGDTGDHIQHGPNTLGTATEYQARTERYAYAAYTQGVYSINEQFALTLGVRWARDQLTGDETAFYYTESELLPLGFSSVTGGTSNLSAINQILGCRGRSGVRFGASQHLPAGGQRPHGVPGQLVVDRQGLFLAVREQPGFLAFVSAFGPARELDFRPGELVGGGIRQQRDG